MSECPYEIHAGFVPLLDAAPLIVAHELGFAEAEGIKLRLSKETSWATIRDRLAVGHLDVAHILAPMPVAANLGLGPLAVPMTVPMALGTGANTIAVSNSFWNALAEHGELNDFDAGKALNSLKKVVRDRQRASASPLTFGIVHPFSAHHYQLAYWLGAGELKNGRDINLVVVPPSLMPAALKSGRLDGFCVGEPWGSLAAAEGSGVILTTNWHIWQNSPEKVLGARQEWVSNEPDRALSLVRALYRAANWCDDGAQKDELSRMLARDEYVGINATGLLPGLTQQLGLNNETKVKIDGFMNFAANAATFPWVSHALWFYSQMVRWGQVPLSDDGIESARKTYRPALYREALRPLGIDLPSANSKVEGALSDVREAGSTVGKLRLGPDAFFDGHTFDPDQIGDYLAHTKK